MRPDTRAFRLRADRDLGYMLYDFDYRNPAHPAPLFFRAELDDGVLDVESVEVRS